MHTMDWDDLRFFLHVAHLGTVSGAATALQVNHSTVLRRLGRLEALMGVRLFDRLPSGYVLTQAGEDLVSLLSNVQRDIDTAQRRLMGIDQEIRGTIRLTTTDTLMHVILMPHLAEFRSLHPNIELQCTVNNVMLNLTRREADVAVRPSNHPPENLLGRRAAVAQFAVYGSRNYMERRRPAAGPEEHAWVSFDETLSHLAQSRWMDANVRTRSVAVRSDSLVAMVAAVSNGVGLGLLPCSLAEHRGELLRLAGPFQELDTHIWVLAHPDLRSVARIKVFTQFLFERLQGDPYLAPVKTDSDRPALMSFDAAEPFRSDE